MDRGARSSDALAPELRSLRRWCTTSASVGAIAWATGFLWVWPRPFDVDYAVALLLLAPLALVPLGLRLVLHERELPRPAFALLRAAVWLALPAALLLLIAFGSPPGTLAAALSVPWLLVTLMLAAAGLTRALARRFVPLDRLALDLALAYVSIGAGWLVLSRYGARPLGFESVIVLLTAIHFHYAGFVLPLLTGLAARALPGRLASLATLGVVVGVPFVALGITLTQLGAAPVFECAAAWFTAMAALVTALLHARLALAPGVSMARLLFAIAGIGLAFAMLLAALYGTRAFADLAWLDIPWMRALHGSANAFGFAVCGLLGWTLAEER
jgi:hypothetical protein